MRSREAGGWFFPAVCVVCALLSAVIAVSALGGASGYTDAVNSLVTPVQAGVSKLWNSARDAAAQDLSLIHIFRRGANGDTGLVAFPKNQTGAQRQRVRFGKEL